MILPTRPVTVSAAEPISVSAVFSASAVALTVTTSLAPLAVIEVAAEPVVIADAVVGRIARGHGQRPGQGAGRDIADQAGHCLGRRPGQRQRRVLRQRGRGHRHGIGAEVVGDRGRRRAGGDRDAVVGCIPRGHGERAGQRTGRDIADQAGHHLGCRPDQGQRRVLGQRGGIDGHHIAARRSRVIEVAAEPVVIAMPLSAALPVVTVRVPVSEPAAISPTRPVTTSAADPIRVSAVFCASAVAVTVTVSPRQLR